MRINKYLALKNICSRREADKLIAAGKVTIDGALVKLGSRVASEEALVEVFLGKGKQKELVYLAFHKPQGIITHSPQQEGEKEIADILHFPEPVFPIGRLDKESSGLIILTNDGRITDPLLNPEKVHDKEYLVRVDKPIAQGALNRMERGVILDDGYLTQPCRTKKLTETRFSLVLTEGKKHQIRRMCAELGYQVRDLKRTRIVNIELKNISPGKFRQINGAELKEFLTILGLN